MSAPTFFIDENGTWVSGAGSFLVPFRTKPLNPEAWFSDPPSCGPGHDPRDTIGVEAINLGSHHRPRWNLKIFWNVHKDVRLISWDTDN